MPIDVTVKLFAHYRNGRYETRKETYPEGTRVGDIVRALGVDTENDPVGILLVNGRHARWGDVLRDGDTLSIFPMLGGG